jgi:hypothetical protein
MTTNIAFTPKISSLIKNATSPGLVLPWLGLFFAFFAVFNGIQDFYLISATAHPIDVDFMDSRIFFHVDYVRDAPAFYDLDRYLISFFPLDMAFPVVYSLLFCSSLGLVQTGKWKKALIWMIILGAGFDYLEDFSFLSYLLSDADAFAVITAVATTMKSILFGLNILVCILMIVVWD